MYYISNQNDQIIAADENLLQSLNIKDINEFLKGILLEEISFTSLLSNNLQVVTTRGTFEYTTKVSSLSSLLGDLNLIYLEKTEDEINEETSFITPNISEEDSDTIFSLRDDTTLDNETKEVLSAESLGHIETIETNDSELFDLTLPNESIQITDDISDDISIDTKESPAIEGDDVLDTTPIIINIQEISDDIGISTEDYNTFLNDYIDTAISLEEELQSEDENTRLSAIDTLTQLADVLQLPEVNTSVHKISAVTEYERSTTVESFYQVLSRLTTKEGISDKLSEEKSLHIEDDTNLSSNTQGSPLFKEGGFGKIYLEDVKPIHFDFQLESAANDLSLPVELIEEFVHDFIAQAHEETKKMLSAYETGDLGAIQKIGHLLKGASSNLRINALADTLYDIQFCEDSNQLEKFIERYWAHFLSLEQQINMITK